MRVRPLQTPQQRQKALAEMVRRELAVVTREVRYIGEQVTTEARVGAKTEGKDYLTQTGKLRSSLGYILTADGAVIGEGGFRRETPSGGKTDRGAEGQQAGITAARQLAAEEGQTGTIRLTMVAGAEYASHLHNRGYDVLDTAELLAERLMRELSEDYDKGKI